MLSANCKGRMWNTVHYQMAQLWFQQTAMIDFAKFQQANIFVEGT